MTYSKYYFIFFLFTSFLISCSASVPLSEASIFNSHKNNPDTLHFKTDSLTWKSSAGVGVSFNTNAIGVKDYLTENHEAQSFNNLYKIGLGFSSATNGKYFSFGYNIGYNVFGVNSTVEIGWNNYITLSSTFYGGEAILQRKIFENSTADSHGGVTLGVYAKKIYYSYNKEPQTLIDVYADILQFRDQAPIYLYGVRSMLHWRLVHQSMTHGFISCGYSPQLEGYMVNFGFTIGIEKLE